MVKLPLSRMDPENVIRQSWAWRLDCAIELFGHKYGVRCLLGPEHKPLLYNLKHSLLTVLRVPHNSGDVLHQVEILRSYTRFDGDRMKVVGKRMAGVR